MPSEKTLMYFNAAKKGDRSEMTKKEYLAPLMLILGILKVILIIILGIFILLSSSFDYLPKYFRTIFAIVIIAYGLFRSVSVFNKFKKKEV